MSKKLLEGVKVIELANFIAAATAGRFLADQGATVIKVESAKGDPLRFTAPSEGRPLDWHENTTWELENANKLNISINTKSEEGREALVVGVPDETWGEVVGAVLVASPGARASTTRA